MRQKRNLREIDLLNDRITQLIKANQIKPLQIMNCPIMYYSENIVLAQIEYMRAEVVE